MNLSVKFRGEEGPLFRLKAPVRAVLFPFSVGGTFTLQNGTSLRIGVHTRLEAMAAARARGARLRA